MVWLYLQVFLPIEVCTSDWTHPISCLRKSDFNLFHRSGDGSLHRRQHSLQVLQAHQRTVRTVCHNTDFVDVVVGCENQF